MGNGHAGVVLDRRSVRTRAPGASGLTPPTRLQLPSTILSPLFFAPKAVASNDFASLIRAVPDFPQKGVVFRDLTPLLLDGAALRGVIDTLASTVAGKRIDRIAAIESRGFILGAPLAVRLGCGFVPVRKLGKLPRRTISREYALEYGTNHLEMHVDAIGPGDQILVVDDVLATGGTARATAELISEAGGVTVAMAFLIEIEALKGRAALPGTDIVSLITY